MLTDAHCHLFQPEKQILSAVSIFSYEDLIKIEKSKDIFPCFAIHPQSVSNNNEQKKLNNSILQDLEKAASERRLAAVGECGFDLYETQFKETEIEQERVFSLHLDIAIKYDLPVVIHLRRAIHKIFEYEKMLKKCRTLIFHSWPGTYEEGETFLRRGFNVYFSFGNPVLNGHKKALKCCSLFPADRILTETDAPYQPRRGKDVSSCEDLPQIIEAIANLRFKSGSHCSSQMELENQIEANFRRIYTF